MKLEIKVIPGAKKNFIKEEPQGMKVYLTAPPIEGRANKALVEFLAQHFNVPQGKIEITKGLKSRRKTINITDI